MQAGALPGDERRIVVETSDDIAVRFPPYRPGMSRLVIDPRRQRSISLCGGKRYVFPAIPQPGRYTLVFSDSLEIDWEGMTYRARAVRVRAAAS